MALNFSTDSRFTGRRDSSDPTGYPYDTFIDGAKPNGTPLTYADVWKSIDGFLQSLLDAGKVTPSGTADKVGASDYLTALMAQYGGELNLYDSAATDSTKSDLARTRIANNIISRIEAETATDAQEASAGLQSGGIYFSGVTEGGAVWFRRTYYDVDPSDVNVSNNTLTYTPALGALPMPGFSADAPIQGVGMEFRNTDGSLVGTSLGGATFAFDSGARTLLQFTGMYPSAGIQTDVARVYIDFDPRFLT